MKTPLILNVATRAQTGRSSSRRLRKDNRIPAILYGKHSDPEKLSVETPEFTRLLKSVAGRAVLIELQRSDRPEKALSFLQEIQRDPITDRYLHLDLHEVKPDEKFEIRVPIRVTGESFGVKNQSGVLEIGVHALRVRCLPADLPEAIDVDVTELKVGETIKVSQVKPVPGILILDDPGQPVVACVEPVAEVVVEAPVAAATPAEGAAAPAADGKTPAPAADGKAAAPAADGKAPAAAGAGDKKAPAPAAGAKPASPAKK
jgi:large subunit ribosomal protein L25